MFIAKYILEAHTQNTKTKKLTMLS